MDDLLFDKYGETRLWAVLVMCGITATILLIVISIPVITLGRHYGRINCAQFSINTGRDIRFVVRSFVDTGECFARTDSGWLPSSQLRDVAP